MSVEHTVQEGESIGSIAFEHGFFWETLWEHGSNAGLKEKRKDPDILLAGDRVHIPDLRVREESKGSDAKHKFKRKGVPAQFVVVLRKPSARSNEKSEGAGTVNHWDFDEPKPENLPDEPDADVPYLLYADGLLVKEGKSDGDGKIKATVSPAARNGVLILQRGTPRERTIELQFRHMDPVTEVQGICKRLVNLGYPCPTDSSEVTPAIRSALIDFQTRHSLKVTGEPDTATQDKLKETYGG